jgi:hypothetical protein
MKRMSRLMCGGLVALAAVTTIHVGPAGAHDGSNQQFKGVIVASGETGARQVVATRVRARGVFDGVGHVVELDNLPGDPDNVNRDDLVFKRGTVHLRNEVTSFAFDVDPRTCRATAEIHQVNTIEGGTGLFADATGTFTATVTGRSAFSRRADGSCDVDRAPLTERDEFVASGTLVLADD